LVFNWLKVCQLILNFATKARAKTLRLHGEIIQSRH